MQISRFLIPITAATTLITLLGLSFSFLFKSNNPEPVSSQNPEVEPVTFITYSSSIRDNFLREKAEVESIVRNYKSNSIGPDTIRILDRGMPRQKSTVLDTFKGQMAFELFPFVIDMIPQAGYLRTSSDTVESMQHVAARWLISEVEELIPIHKEIQERYRVGSNEFLNRYFWGEEEKVHQAWMELWLEFRKEFVEFG